MKSMHVSIVSLFCIAGRLIIIRSGNFVEKARLKLYLYSGQFFLSIKGTMYIVLTFI
jgi:hypothetical protein